MKVYQVGEAEDESEYGRLYRQCQEMEGVEYVGSIPQSELACELQSILVLAYPNTFAETSCIAVMEAMASGCWIVTSDLGALPETTAGFARLIPIEEDWEVYKERFVEEIVRVLRAYTALDTTNTETHLRRQVEYVNHEYNWSNQSQKWVKWLSSIQTKNALVDTSLLLDPVTVKSTDLQLLAYQYLLQGEYSQSVAFYKRAIEACPTINVQLLVSRLNASFTRNSYNTTSKKLL
jgi:tetratricopeptide (TPR) repeat protein